MPSGEGLGVTRNRVRWYKRAWGVGKCGYSGSDSVLEGAVLSRPAGYCPKCDYPVDGGVCPECGNLVGKPAARPRARLRRRLKRLGVALLGLAAFAVLCYFAVPPLAARLLPIGWLEDLSKPPANSKRWAGLVSWAERAITNRAVAWEQRIEAELATLRDHPWAGDYGAFLLAPQTGFVDWPFDHWNDSFQIPKFGTIEVLDQHRLRLASTSPRDDYRSGIYYVFTHRGDQWLVKEDWMPWLCAEWNGCGRLLGQYGAYTRRRPKPEVPTVADMDMPLILPPPYDAMLLSKPIEASVIGVEFQPPMPDAGALGNPQDDGSHRLFLILDVGLEDGVWQGCRFLLVDQPEDFCVVMEAIDVDDETSRCKANISLERDEFEYLQGPDCPFRVGVRVSTRRSDGNSVSCCAELIQ